MPIHIALLPLYEVFFQFVFCSQFPHESTNTLQYTVTIARIHEYFIAAKNPLHTTQTSISKKRFATSPISQHRNVDFLKLKIQEYCWLFQ